jgi:tRNA threonylcarbamoyladenosine biosynthesis protein TsaB
MAYILSIETSTQICSIALHQNGLLVDLAINEGKGAHSQLLMRMISDLLGRCNLSTRQLSAIAVSKGPGSYTGLRIGVSTAKGLAFAWDLPLISIPTLKLLAYAAIKNIEGITYVIPVLDARRMEVYREVFDSKLNTLSALDSELIDQNSFKAWLDLDRVCFLGDGAVKLKEVLEDCNAIFLDIEISARFMGELAFDKYKMSNFENLAYFVPNYLKEFKALHSKKNPLLS